MQNVVPAQPCVGKYWISLILLNFLHCNFRLWFKTPQPFNSYPCHASEVTRNTLNHCLKFTVHSIFCHICYGKISENICDTLMKVKLLVSKTSDSCFQGFDFFQMLLASHRYWKYQTSSLIFIKNKEGLQEGWIPKNSIACISCTSCQHTRSISSSRQHRFSTQVGMQHHIYLLSSLIISFYILTKFLLCYMFSKGHVTLT